MFLWNRPVKAWRPLLEWLRCDRRRKVLEILCREYVEEMESSLRLEWHAEQMRYPQFCERLLGIAADVFLARTARYEDSEKQDRHPAHTITVTAPEANLLPRGHR